MEDEGAGRSDQNETSRDTRGNETEGRRWGVGVRTTQQGVVSINLRGKEFGGTRD